MGFCTLIGLAGKSLGFRVKGLRGLRGFGVGGFRVKGFRVWGLGFRGLGFGV